MLPIVFGDPAWSDTFPHRVTPKPGEGLVSLLLRCDEENRWASGTTLAHLNDMVYNSVDLAYLIVPSQLSVDALARWLCLPISTVAATTYLWELVRFFETATPSPGDLCFWFVFHLCPACIKQYRVLLRCHFLLGMTSCLQHRLSLLSSCTCGAALQPFDPRTSPFTCPVCQKDWGDLPHVAAAPGNVEKEQHILACYEWWFRYGDQKYLKDLSLRLMHLDAIGRPKFHPERSSRWSLREPRRRAPLRSSLMGPLSAVVSQLDERDLLSRFSGERGI